MEKAERIVVVLIEMDKCDCDIIVEVLLVLDCDCEVTLVQRERRVLVKHLCDRSQWLELQVAEVSLEARVTPDWEVGGDNASEGLSSACPLQFLQAAGYLQSPWMVSREGGSALRT